MSNKKRAVIIVNIGSPDSYSVSDVHSYLKEFLTDPCVIDRSAWVRYLLVYGIIAPFRSFRSAKRYENLWTRRGFPLIYHSRDLENEIKPLLSSGTDLFLAMRYGAPSLKKLLQSIKETDYSELLVIPLYPQYASSTTGSVIRILKRELGGYKLAGRTRVVPQFHQDDDFIKLWRRKIIAFNPSCYDAVIFSFHGVPVRQPEVAHPRQTCDSMQCRIKYNERNRYCYLAACFRTVSSIAHALNLETDQVHTSFQSRFGSNWLGPGTRQTIINLARKGKRRVLIITPSFVADCLETSVEIAMEYNKIFKKAGGEELTLVPSLNSDPEWASFIVKLVKQSRYHSMELKMAPFYLPASSNCTSSATRTYLKGDRNTE